MAVFAKYDGIDGEATDAHHDKWVDILSLDWGVHRADAGATGQSRRRGSAVVEDLMLTFGYEKAATKLLDKCLKGEVVPQLDIELTATYGGARVTYLKYELKKVMVTSYHVSASGDDGAGPPTVIVANNFEELKVTYTEFDDAGASVGNVETVYKRDKRSRSKSAAVKVAAKKSGGQKRKKSK